MTETNPSISVLLPVYNAEPYIRDAVESILAQTFRDFELLILDDGSTDGSLNILLECQEKDSRISVKSRENRGHVASLNELISKSRGRYLARMDADDVSLPHRFKQQFEFLEANLDHVAVGGWPLYINSKGLRIGVIQTPLNHDEIDQANLKGHASIWNPTAMMRKSAVMGVGCYREQYKHAEDLDLWLRLAEIGKLQNIPDVVLLYRLHATSISESKGDAQRADGKLACAEAWRVRGITGKYEASDLWRPTDLSMHQYALQYGWMAWAHGYRSTWRNYAREALLLRPFSLDTWKLIVFGFLKRPVGQLTKWD